MLTSTQQGKGLLSNLLVWTPCFGSNQQLHQHSSPRASYGTRLVQGTHAGTMGPRVTTDISL